MRVDLNADVGESFGAHLIGSDGALMRSITSANIAAGFHGGDPTVLRETIRLANKHGVEIGAHPGFPDLQGFGRREMRIAPGEIEDLVLYQIAAVAGVAAAEGARLRHVKPHGALYNMAARDSELASAIARAVAAFDRSLILYALPDSELLKAGRATGTPRGRRRIRGSRVRAGWLIDGSPPAGRRPRRPGSRGVPCGQAPGRASGRRERWHDARPPRGDVVRSR